MDWKSRFYAKSTPADVQKNYRFNVDVHTSILSKRFYTLWANSGPSRKLWSVICAAIEEVTKWLSENGVEIVAANIVAAIETLDRNVQDITDAIMQIHQL